MKFRRKLVLGYISLVVIVYVVNFAMMVEFNSEEIPDMIPESVHVHVRKRLEIPADHGVHDKAAVKRIRGSSARPLSAALVLFGIPKEFEKIWKAYINQIVKRNPHVKFEAHLHTYSDLKQQTNIKNNEVNAIIESPTAIQRILKLGNITSKLVTSSQSEYDKSLGWIKKTDLDSFDRCCWTVDTLKNMFRQGNSLKQAFFSASNVQENTTKQKSQYDMYFFIRSDTLLLSPIDIPCDGLPSNQLDVPSWQVFEDTEYVDRFALSGTQAAAVYAMAKSDVFREIILDRRGPNKLTWATRPSKAGNKHDNSERLLRQWLDENPQIKVKCMGPNWAKLLRIRAGGVINERDANTFRVKVKNVKDLKI